MIVLVSSILLFLAGIKSIVNESELFELFKVIFRLITFFSHFLNSYRIWTSGVACPEGQSPCDLYVNDEVVDLSSPDEFLSSALGDTTFTYSTAVVYQAVKDTREAFNMASRLDEKRFFCQMEQPCKLPIIKSNKDH